MLYIILHHIKILSVETLYKITGNDQKHQFLSIIFKPVNIAFYIARHLTVGSDF